MDISKQLTQLEKHLVNLINEKHEETSKQIRNDILDFKDEVLTKIDRLETDNLVASSYRGLIADHEARITKI